MADGKRGEGGGGEGGEEGCLAGRKEGRKEGRNECIDYFREDQKKMIRSKTNLFTAKKWFVFPFTVLRKKTILRSNFYGL